MSELLKDHNFKFQKKYGQNFLQDVKIPRRIAMECTHFTFPDGDTLPETKADCLILEIGPGAGILTKELAKRFCVVDSFDTHANIPAHFANVDAAAREAGTIGVISCGWDPGLFSLARLYASAALPNGADYTFWGRGVSQGHSDAIRRIPGVLDARQYTVPVESAVEAARSGKNPELTTRQKHTRECFVVAEEGADLAAIEEAIVTMPNYFADYDTTVTFISQEELNANHAGLPHGGTVIRSGRTGLNYEFGDTVEFSLALDSNPFFTGSVLASVARAAYRMHQDGQVGARTMFDIPPALLSPLSAEELRAHLM
jgi:diaminopimelate dehydrogenase